MDLDVVIGVWNLLFFYFVYFLNGRSGRRRRCKSMDGR